MNKQFVQHQQHLMGDLDTPISIYLKLRDQFERVILLESNEFNRRENSRSMICCASLLSIRVSGQTVTVSDDLQTQSRHLPTRQVMPYIQELMEQVQVADGTVLPGAGFFGHLGYDAVRYCEDIEVTTHSNGSSIPDIALDFYRYVIVFDHFTQTTTLLEHAPPGEPNSLARLKQMLRGGKILLTPFRSQGATTSNMSDSQYAKNVQSGIAHCLRGDVFQVVLSRSFTQKYQGDDFNVYRSLRTINPSPYLFYFDFGSYRLLGSSPEAQLIIHDNKAQIMPIAGTYPRTGDDHKDLGAAETLLKDGKELAEHTMLVDLARNDLNRHGTGVQVIADKEIQMYSHVIHMVSRVEGQIPPETGSLSVFADCFPAGTLSGAPKYRAMEIIRALEADQRGFYGGAIGYFGLNGDINTAIMIRSILSTGNSLKFQAGAGVVASSDPDRETAEVHHKVKALINAIEHATLQSAL